MKKNKLSYWLPAALLLAGCGNNTDFTGIANTGTLQVEAAIQAETGRSVSLSNYDKRAFDTNDKIIIQESGGKNHTYSKSTKGYWISTDPCTISSSSSATYTGYYPTADAAVPEDQTTAEAFHNGNLLKTPAVSPTGNTVKFTGANAFKPQGVKITIIVRYDQKYTPVSATITDTGNGKINATSSSTRCLYTTADNRDPASLQNWACILTPGKYTLKFSIVKQINSSSSTTGTFTDVQREFIMGKNYIYNFLSTDELILTGVTVTPFIESAAEEETGSAT